MSETRRLRMLSAREQRVNEERMEIQNKIVDEILEVMTKHRIDLSVLRNAFKAKFNKDQPQNRRYAKRPIRFRDPETGDTWAGVGVKPKWLRRRLEQGYSLENFRVDPPKSVE